MQIVVPVVIQTIYLSKRDPTLSPTATHPTPHPHSHPTPKNSC